MKTAQTMTNDTLTNIMTQLAALSQQVANVVQNQPVHNTIGGHDDDNYNGDTEHDELSNNNNARDRRRQPAN
jgi:fructose-1,6-bisphosphatase